MNNRKTTDLFVNVQIFGGAMAITLNRPKALNSLNLEMIHRVQNAMDEAALNESIRVVVLQGAGVRAFCAGADIKTLALAVKENRQDQAMRFYREEYALDLCLHDFQKPVVLIARGITMGGGLGLAAGADIVPVTETTRMAMPETRIGFFPDVGATGWMFGKSPEGYAEFLGLTGFELIGGECVRLGLATHLILSERIEAAIDSIYRNASALSREKDRAVDEIGSLLAPFAHHGIDADPEMDRWVQTYFAGKGSVTDILDELKRNQDNDNRCGSVLQLLGERSPTSVALTLKLLRYNKGRPIKEVFHTDIRALGFILKHPDYVEGVRARLLDKDNRPNWRPSHFEAVGPLDLDL